MNGKGRKELSPIAASKGVPERGGSAGPARGQDWCVPREDSINFSAERYLRSGRREFHFGKTASSKSGTNCAGGFWSKNRNFA
jgi:hypothetical protein